MLEYIGIYGYMWVYPSWVWYPWSWIWVFDECGCGSDLWYPKVYPHSSLLTDVPMWFPTPQGAVEEEELHHRIDKQLEFCIRKVSGALLCFEKTVDQVKPGFFSNGLCRPRDRKGDWQSVWINIRREHQCICM